MISPLKTKYSYNIIKLLKDYEGEVSIEYDDETGCITIDGDGFTTFIETGDEDDYFDEDEDEYDDEDKEDE